MKWVLWLAYGFLLLIGAVWLRPVSPNDVFAITAARPLPRGHLLAAGDVTLAGGARYVIRDLAPGTPLRAADVAAFPSAAVAKGGLPVLLEMHNMADRPLLDAGTKVWICPSDQPRAPPVRLVSLICPDNGDRCLALVDLPAVRGADVGKNAAKISAKPCE